MTRSTVFREIKDYGVIALGLVVYALAFTFFQLPHQIPSGGVAGAGAIIFYATGFPVQFTYFAVNTLLLIAAVRTLGWKFCVKTIYAVVVLTVLLSLSKSGCQYYGALHPELNVSPQGLPMLLDDAFMSCIFGALLQGFSIGYVFLHNGSTGGTDIIAAITNKYRDVSLGRVVMLCDLLIISSSILVPGFTISNLLYGFCTLIISSITIDYVVDRRRQSVQFFIFSEKYEEIASAINATGRGVTMLKGEGWYTKSDRMVLVVMARKRESNRIFRIIQTIDPAAFVSQSKVIGVYGYGFDKLKIKADKPAGASPQPGADHQSAANVHPNNEQDNA